MSYYQIRADFYHHAAAWDRETCFSSNMSENVRNAHYQAIIAMGEDVVYILLEELQRRPHWWFNALAKITCASPEQPEHAGRLDLLAKDWIEWGIKNHYLPNPNPVNYSQEYAISSSD